MQSRDRVPAHTSAEVNQTIENRTIGRLEYYAGNPAQIESRLQELDEEWDVERTLETNASILSLLGLTMGFMVSRRWFLLPLAVQSFFLQHALQGWCPPLPILRRYGFRTSEEIERERTALKAIRGDFQAIGEEQSADELKGRNVWQAAGLRPRIA